MRHNLFAKLATLSTGLGLSLAFISTHPAWGATFTFEQKSFSGEPFVSGTFSGKDANDDNVLEINELSNFQALLAASSVSFSLNDLTEFDYILGSKNSIFFSVQKRVDVNNEFADYEEYMLGVNGFDSFSFLAIYFYKNDDPNPFAVADGASNQPVQVQSVPEPLPLTGLILVSLIGTSLKRNINSSSNSKRITKKPSRNLLQ